MIKIKRVYEKPEEGEGDGVRILVDRLWPRGLSKEYANIDYWFKNIAPSTELRKAFHEGKIDFNEFEARYLKELSDYYGEGDNEIKKIKSLLHNEKDKSGITLLYGLKDEVNNNAAVLRKFILRS